MKKSISIVLLIAAMLLIFTGCGGTGAGTDTGTGTVTDTSAGTDTNFSTGTDTDKAATSIEGTWKCVDLVMMENGEKFLDKQKYEEIMGESIDNLFALSIYSDGKGDFTMMGESLPIIWVEDGEKYNVTPDYPADVPQDETDTSEMTMSLEGGKITFSVTGETTSTNSEGVETQIKEETLLYFESTGK